MNKYKETVLYVVIQYRLCYTKRVESYIAVKYQKIVRWDRMNILQRIAQFKDSEAIAMVHNEQSITYKQLWLYSNRLAGYLQKTLQEDKSPLVVYGHKDPLMLVCFLACVKSGRAYCPIDVTVPKQRVDDIVQAVNGKIIMAVERMPNQYVGTLTKESLLRILEENSYDIDEKDYVKDNDVYYIIFTSGSTGTPKGVQITQANLSHFVDWALTLGGNDKSHKTYINQAPFSFDLSVMDVYMSLASGGTLWSLDKAIQKEYASMFASLEESKANIWVSTPSFVDLCLVDKNFNQSKMLFLELFLFCGETLTNKTVEQLQQRFDNAKVINTYGPTESTVAISEVEVTKEVVTKYNPLPVGKAKPGTWIKIMEDGKEVAPGHKGEIIIIGNTVSSGYYQNTENTKKAFFTMDIDGIHYPAYHTGDLGYIQDGMLFYNGRIDLQIKLHGYRMEIEDIEKNILKIEKIKNVVVLPNYQDGKVKSLTAYCIYDGDTSARLKTTQSIKNELKACIPDYMIPKKFIFLDSLPLTNNGKVDRKKLMETML